MRLKPKGKKMKMEAESRGPPFSGTYSPVMRSSPHLGGNIYTQIFLHLFYRRSSLIILEFSHLICLNHKIPVNLPKNRKSAKNLTNLVPAHKSLKRNGQTSPVLHQLGYLGLVHFMRA